MNPPYLLQNPKASNGISKISKPLPPVPPPKQSGTNEQLTDNPWFINTHLDLTDANRILEDCETVENGNFLVRKSATDNTKYTITIWFNNKSTHVRINQLNNGQYQVDFQPNSSIQLPSFSTIKELIDFYSKNEMKLIGHCQGFVKLKFNSDILKYLNNQAGVVSYGT